jgi:hypothetical protein
MSAISNYSYCYDETIFYNENGEESEYEYITKSIDDVKEKEDLYRVFDYNHEDSLKDLKTRVYISVCENKRKIKNIDIFFYEGFGENVKRINFDFIEILKFKLEYTKDDLEKLTLYIDADHEITLPELNHAQNNHIIENLYYKFK